MKTALFTTWSPFNKWFRLVGTPLFGLLIYGVLYFVDPRSFETAGYTGANAWRMYAYDLLACLLGSFVLSELSIWSTQWLDRWLPWPQRPLRRFAVQFLTLTVDSILVVMALVYVITVLEHPGYEWTEADRINIRQTVVFSCLMALFLNAIHTGEYFFSRWRRALLDAERLKRESVEARYEALKNQLDPHFLFNNLTTLTYLVDDNPRAVSFVENLALVYRYVLQNREKTLVPLADELKLAEAYVFLLKNRFGEGLRVRVNVPDGHHERLIPPLTLQLLLENAVKHNVVSLQHPLHVTIRCDAAGELVVQNSRRPRQSVEGKTGIGLRNIRHRYALLTTARSPAIEETDAQFTVRLPLIE